MANGFAKAWSYVSAWFGAQVDEKADPKIQIQQAITESQRQHESLTRQAASVIGNQHQLELKLDRQLGQIETLQAQTRQALLLADKARTDGDEAKAAEFEETATMLANQLVTAESGVTDLKQLHDQSIGAAEQARQAVADSAAALQGRLAERTKLLSQLEQAKMQEQVATSLQQMGQLTAPGNAPSLEEVRDKIEKRYSTALGQADLASNSMAGRMREVNRATANLAGQSKLAEIRASLGAGSASTPPVDHLQSALGSPAPAVGQGQSPGSDAAKIPLTKPADDPANPAGQ